MTALEKKISKFFKQHRKKIDQADMVLLKALNQRFKIVEKIGLFKIKHSLNLEQKGRFQELLKQRVKYANKLGIPNKLTKSLFTLIHDQSLSNQKSLKRSKHGKS